MENNEPFEVQVNTVIPPSTIVGLALMIVISGIVIVLASQIANSSRS